MKTLAMIVLLSAASTEAKPKEVVFDVEIYGSSKISAQMIQDKFGADLKRYLQRKSVKSKMVQKEAADLRVKIVAGVKALGGFSWLELEEVRLPSEEGERPTLFMFEVVEKEDMARRMPLSTPPKGAIPDNSGLLEAYAAYDKAGWDLVRKNELKVDRNECPAYYCTWGAATPELGRQQEGFSGRVANYKDLLVKILAEDADENRRAQAVYLLAYLSDGAEVSNLISGSLFDPSDKVRGAVMAVYTDIAIYHKDVPIPVHQILRLLDLPFSGDRSRALALMLSIANNPDYRQFILHKASPAMLRLLRVKHPINRQNAHTVFTLFSGLDHPATDVEAWDAWFWKARREKPEE